MGFRFKSGDRVYIKKTHHRWILKKHDHLKYQVGEIIEVRRTRCDVRFNVGVFNVSMDMLEKVGETGINGYTILTKIFGENR